MTAPDFTQASVDELAMPESAVVSAMFDGLRRSQVSPSLIAACERALPSGMKPIHERLEEASEHNARGLDLLSQAAVEFAKAGVCFELAAMKLRQREREGK